MKRKSAFTLLELLITVVIVGILSTIGIASYQSIVEKSKVKVCEQNIKMLTTAVKIYSLENDSLPAALSKVPVHYYNKAYAQVIEKGPKHLKLARKLINEPIFIDHAYAIDFNQENFKDYGTTADAFICPSDKNGGKSYAVNRQTWGQRWNDLPSGMAIIIDSDAGSFNGGAAGVASKRHKLGFGPGARNVGHIGTKTGVVTVDQAGNVVKGTRGSCTDGKGGYGGPMATLCMDSV